MNKPRGWPRGADEELVRECNCEYCTQLVDLLESATEAQPPLTAFGGDD